MPSPPVRTDDTGRRPERRRHRTSLWRAAKRTLQAIWLAALVATALAWFTARTRPRTLWCPGEQRHTSLVLESYAGHLLIIVLHFPDAKVDQAWLAHNGHPGGDHALRVTWIRPDGERRGAQFPLVRPGGEYGNDQPQGSDGWFKSLTFAGGEMKLALGRSKLGIITHQPERIAYAQAVLPCWVVLVVFGAIPMVFLVRPVARALRRQLFHRPGHCPHCGYDLRASPDRCPECGRPTPAAPPPSPGSVD